MKKTTFFVLFFGMTLLLHAQVLNQPANWPNANWTTSGTYNPDGLVNDPTINNAFTFDDDAAGSTSDDDIASESPIIDLTAAFNASEVQISISGTFMYREITSANDVLAVEYWDADAASWVSILALDGTANPNTYENCDNMFNFQAGIDISGFTPSQLSGFKYRYSYDDDDGWQWGWCIQNSAIVSGGANPPNCDAIVTAPFDGETNVSLNPTINWSAATGFPDGYFISIGTTDGGTDIVNNVDVGNVLTYNPAPLNYSTTYYITITPYNANGNATGCVSSSFTTLADPSQTVDCAGAPINTIYCYENNDTTFWLFTSSDGSPLRITFNAGTIEGFFDDITIYDGVDNTAPILFNNNTDNQDDLTGLVLDSTGDSLFIEVDSDSSVSCASGSEDQWDFTVSCATCVNPTASYTIVDDCMNGPQFFVDVDLTDLGSATSVTITDNQGSTPQTTAVIGTFTFGPFANNTPIIITVTNDDDGNCEITSPSITQEQCVFNEVDCAAGPLNLQYCYENNDTRQWLFTSTDGSPVRITFNAGTIEGFFDDITIYDGADNTAPILFNNNADDQDDLAGLVIQSSSDNLFMEVDSDGSVSCASGSEDLWDFTVVCATCVNPTATYTVVEDCLNGQQFLIDVDLTDLGSATSITISDNQGSTPQTVTATGVVQFGPYPNLTDVVITVTNDDDFNCVLTSPSLTQEFCELNIIDCDAGITNYQYCYENNDTRTWLFTTTNGFPVRLSFNSGTIEGGFDDITIYDGPDNASPILFNNNTAGINDLTGLEFISSGDSMFMEVDSDFIISCSSGSETIWDFDVSCLTCQPQTATYTVNGSCEPNPEFFVDVDITDLGTATSITVSDDQGSADQVVTTTGIVTFGPYAANTLVVITVANTDNADCIISSDPLTFLCPPPPNECSIIFAGDDVSVDCQNPSTDLTATFMTSGVDNTVYEINQLPSCPTPPLSGGTPSGVDIDDRWSDAIDLTFDFCFFGDTYDQIVIGANGLLSFDVSQAGLFCPWQFSASVPSPALPLNAIYGAYHDIDPSVCGNIEYFVLGSAPARQFVVNFVSTCHFSCNNLETTQQIILYESSNNIDVNIFDKPTCTTWNGGNAVIGVQDATGSLGYTPPGRNTGPWSATDEFWRFSNAGDPNYTFEWLDGTTSIGTTETITVTPEVTTTYTAAVTYTLCDGSTATITNDVVVDVIPPMINIAQPNDTEVCVDSVDAIATTDLTAQEADILNGLTGYFVDYYETFDDADNNVGAIGNPESYTTISNPQTIYVRVEDQNFPNCYVVTSFVINVVAKPFEVLSDCVDERLNLTVNPINNAFDVSQSTFNLYDDSGGLLYANSQGDNVLVINPEDFSNPISGMIYNFTVEVIDGSNCSITKDVTYESISCIFPQGISPNNDGFNDNFDLTNYDVRRLEIFSRTGTLVYSQDNYSKQWAGQSKNGDLLPVGTYFYVAYFNDSSREPVSSWVYVNY